MTGREYWQGVLAGQDWHRTRKEELALNAGPEWGPLARLAGVWEGEKGEDVAYANETGKIGLTPFREHIDFKPFGPVENGAQILYGLDYRMAGWRGVEENPFHTEVGYWLWDAVDSQVIRCFIMPRGLAIVAGGTVESRATVFSLEASAGVQTYGILSNRFLDQDARTVRFEVTIDTSVDDEFTYSETSILQHSKWPDQVSHTDRNTLRRIGDA